MGIYRLSNGIVRLETRARAADDASTCRIRMNPGCRTAKIAASLACIASTSVFGAAKNASPMHLPGYKAVPVYYEPLNKMIMPVRINGQPAKLLVDTGATQVILNRDAAELAGVKPLQRSLGQVRFLVPNQVFTLGSEINGQAVARRLCSGHHCWQHEFR